MVLALAKSIHYAVPATCDLRFVQMNLDNKCVIVGEKKINYIFFVENLVEPDDLVG